jgi:Hint domain
MPIWSSNLRIISAFLPQSGTTKVTHAQMRSPFMSAIVLDQLQTGAETDNLLGGILAGTSVLTLEGEIPVQFLAPGDRVITRSGARKLVHVAVHTVECADVIRIKASALGHDRPGDDMILAPGQLIHVRDWRAKALYGTAEAAVPAARLVDGDYIRHDRLLEARFFTLAFDAPAVIYADGLEVACPTLAVQA